MTTPNAVCKALIQELLLSEREMKSAYYKALILELLLSEREMKPAYRTLRLRMPPRALNETITQKKSANCALSANCPLRLRTPLAETFGVVLARRAQSGCLQRRWAHPSWC